MNHPILPDANVLDAEIESWRSDGHRPALDSISRYLTGLRANISWDAWKNVCIRFREHPLQSRFSECPLYKHAYRKPRGYPGDAVVEDYLLGLVPHSELVSEAGELLYRAQFHTSLARSARWRRGLFARRIDDTAARLPRPDILSFACGHLREGSDSRAIIQGRIGRLVALDEDDECLAVVRELWGDRVQVVSGGARALANWNCGISTFDFIYFAGRHEYLTDQCAERVNQTLFRMLRPGGTLLISNFAPNLPDMALMEAGMDWWMIYRDEVCLQRITRTIPASNSRRHYRDPDGCIAFLEIEKSA